MPGLDFTDMYFVLVHNKNNKTIYPVRNPYKVYLLIFISSMIYCFNVK